MTPRKGFYESDLSTVLLLVEKIQYAFIRKTAIFVRKTSLIQTYVYFSLSSLEKVTVSNRPYLDQMHGCLSLHFVQVKFVAIEVCHRTFMQPR